jgi:hypothetical protein
LRIAVIEHESARHFWRSPYILRVVAEIWRDRGIEVSPALGPHGFVEADAAVLHVDLTVVPEVYLGLARRYPVALNARTHDISKRSIAAPLAVATGDGWAGPVIVKTDRNFGGEPEERAAAARYGPAARFVARLRRRLPVCWGGPLDPHSYPIYPHVDDVPRWVWRDARLVVQRFLPEKRGGLYCLRRWTFLGDHELNTLSFADGPIVKAKTTKRRENLGPPPAELRAARERLGFDYGKFDYAIVDGGVVLYDVNRTPTFSAAMPESDQRRAAAALVDGLLAFVAAGARS